MMNLLRFVKVNNELYHETEKSLGSQAVFTEQMHFKFKNLQKGELHT